MSRASTIDNEETPLAYAARLAKYISDPSTIHARTKDFWGRAPSVAECANLRARVERQKREYREACEQRADRASLKEVSDDFPCGHERSDENTYHIGNRESCRACQKELQAAMWADVERKRQREALAAEQRRKLEEAQPAPPILINPFTRILNCASDLTAISVEDITSRRRFRRVVRPRFAVIHALRSIGFSLPRIAAMLNIKDHTSIIHALEQVDVMRPRDPDFDALCLALEAAARTKPEPLPAHVVAPFIREAA